MSIIIGTSHFTDRAAAIRYYHVYGYGPADVDCMIIRDEIHIGKPTIKPGERLVVIDNCRWGIGRPDLPPEAKLNTLLEAVADESQSQELKRLVNEEVDEYARRMNNIVDKMIVELRRDRTGR